MSKALEDRHRKVINRASPYRLVTTHISHKLDSSRGRRYTNLLEDSTERSSISKRRPQTPPESGREYRYLLQFLVRHYLPGTFLGRGRSRAFNWYIPYDPTQRFYERLKSKTKVFYIYT